MPDYRAYILNIDGHRFIRAEFLSNHPDDATALIAAKKLIEGHDVELWDEGRLVARLDKDGNPISDFPTLAETIVPATKIESKELASGGTVLLEKRPQSGGQS
jgi:hypothetical protein